MVPYDQKHLVRCSSSDRGKATMTACQAGCIGCKKCEKVCKFDAIKVENNNALIDPVKCKNCGMCLKECPTGAINSFNLKHAKLAIAAKEKKAKEAAEKKAAAAQA